jgi:hypothetical protein
MMTFEEMGELKRRHSARLLGMPGVCGVGVEQDTAGRPVLTVHVDGDDAEAPSDLPAEIEGQKLRVVRSGPYRKQ